jgi:hypothetical protein
MTTLHFRATQTFTSEPVAISSISNLERYLLEESSQIQSLLLSGSGNNIPQRLSKIDAFPLLEEWRQQSRMVGAELPPQVVSEGGDEGKDDDVVYQVKTGGINFAGLRVQSNALIGVKIVHGVKDKSCESNEEVGGTTSGRHLPEYQLVYIKDEQTVEGPKVLVWIFHKLTGKNSSGSRSSSISSSNNDDENVEVSSNPKQQSVSSFSTFYVDISQDAKEAIFTIESMLDIAIKFPTFLLKILPVSKEKAEEQGSASVMKTLVRDTGASLQRTVEHYKQVGLVPKATVSQ